MIWLQVSTVSLAEEDEQAAQAAGIRNEGRSAARAGQRATDSAAAPVTADQGKGRALASRAIASGEDGRDRVLNIYVCPVQQSTAIAKCLVVPRAPNANDCQLAQLYILHHFLL